MFALQEERGKLSGKITTKMRAVGNAEGEYLLDGAVQFINHIQLFDATFGELGITHDLRDDAVSLGDFFTDDVDLLTNGGFLLSQVFLEGVGDVVDDGERVLDL